jgi:hypothetical protein
LTTSTTVTTASACASVTTTASASASVTTTAARTTAATESTAGTFGKLERLAFHLLEVFLLITCQHSKGPILHLLSHLSKFLTHIFAITPREDFSHFLTQFTPDAFHFLFLRLGDTQRGNSFRVVQSLDAAELQNELLKTLDLRGHQNFLQLLLHLLVTLLLLLSHLGKHRSTLFLAHVANVAKVWTLPSALFGHLGQGLFLVRRDLQLDPYFLNAKQLHRRISTATATATAKSAAAWAASLATASSATTAAVTTSTLVLAEGV